MNRADRRDVCGTRRTYGLYVYGYVVMPEHIHLLVSEPAKGTLADALKSLKQGVSRRLIGGTECRGQDAAGHRTAPLKPKPGLSGPPA